MDEGIDDVTLTDMINEVDLNQNGKLELDEFLQVRSKCFAVTKAKKKSCVILQSLFKFKVH